MCGNEPDQAIKIPTYNISRLHKGLTSVGQSSEKSTNPLIFHRSHAKVDAEVHEK